MVDQCEAVEMAKGLLNTACEKRGETGAGVPMVGILVLRNGVAAFVNLAETEDHVQASICLTGAVQAMNPAYVIVLMEAWAAPAAELTVHQQLTAFAAMKAGADLCDVVDTATQHVIALLYQPAAAPRAWERQINEDGTMAEMHEYDVGGNRGQWPRVMSAAEFKQHGVEGVYLGRR